MYKELLEKLPPHYITTRRIDDFMFAVQGKFQRGSTANKEVKQFDPLFEAKQECLDIALYAMLLYFRIEALKEKLSVGG